MRVDGKLDKLETRVESSAHPLGGRHLGRYVVYESIAAGGMATVHIGRLVGPAGFARTVAIKRLHPHYAADPDFTAMFLDEARVAARIRHPNVVTTHEVVSLGSELFLVMEYVHGESLAALARRMAQTDGRIPFDIVAAIIVDTLSGLHAAHEARDEQGRPLDVVHRDVSPQNILVGADGVSRVVDFGIAKAKARLHTTSDGSVKGKIAYMAPEQLLRKAIDRRADIFACGVVLWEALTGRRLFAAEDPAASVAAVLACDVPPPSQIVSSLGPAVDEVVLRALSAKATRRFPTAREMALALEVALPPARPRVVGEWVEDTARSSLAARDARIAAIEALSGASAGTTGPIAVPLVGGSGTNAPASEDRRRRRARPRFIVACALSVTLVVAIAGIGRGYLGGSRVAASNRIVDPDKAGAASSVPSDPSDVPAAAAPAPSESAPASPRAHAAATPPQNLNAKAGRAVKPARASTTCDPPFIVDERGRRFFKPDCF